MKVTRKIMIIKYWKKLLIPANDTLTKNIYHMLHRDASNSNNYYGLNWATHVKNILGEIGLSYIWLNQDFSTININMIRHKIIDSYTQEWHFSINNSSRLQSYCKFQNNLELDFF